MDRKHNNSWYLFDNEVWLSLDKNIDHHNYAAIPNELISYFKPKVKSNSFDKGEILLIGQRKAMYAANIIYSNELNTYYISWWNHFRRRISRKFPSLYSFKVSNNMDKSFIIQFKKLEYIPENIKNKIINDNLKHRFIALNDLTVFTIKMFEYNTGDLSDFKSLKI